ncbi:hypothetical protein LZ554_004192 [Drepanopeziza brunnea f. sp. 'monogermtubi']|nr:hypothetical protein LZ554_004192 [Drepanopeziza brunnea f. sp. 'monogermtubi']
MDTGTSDSSEKEERRARRKRAKEFQEEEMCEIRMLQRRAAGKRKAWLERRQRQKEEASSLPGPHVEVGEDESRGINKRDTGSDAEPGKITLTRAEPAINPTLGQVATSGLRTPSLYTFPALGLRMPGAANRVTSYKSPYSQDPDANTAYKSPYGKVPDANTLSPDPHQYGIPRAKSPSPRPVPRRVTFAVGPDQDATDSEPKLLSMQQPYGPAAIRQSILAKRPFGIPSEQTPSPSKKRQKQAQESDIGAGQSQGSPGMILGSPLKWPF